MSTTVTLSATGSAIINGNDKSKNLHNINSKTYGLGGDLDESYLLLVFPGVDQQYQFRPFSTVYHVYGKATASLGTPEWHARIGEYSEFDPLTVNYNNAPSPKFPYTNAKSTQTHSGGAGWETVSDFPVNIYTNANYYICDYWGVDSVTVYGSASTSYKPYVVITFEDNDAYLKFKTLSPADGSVVFSGMDQRFSWTTEPSALTAAELTQVSATFQWKKPDDEDWTEVAISGNTKNVTIPAGTFPGGKILWRVVLIDVTGHTRTSATMTAYTTATLRCSSAAIVGTELGDANIPYNSEQIYAIRSGLARALIAKFQQIPAGVRYYKLIQTVLLADFANNLSSAQGYRLFGQATTVDIQTVKVSDLSTVNGQYGFGSFSANAANTPQIPKNYIATNAPTGATTALKTALGSRGILTTDCVIVQALSDSAFTVSGDLLLEVAYDDSITISSQVRQKNCPTSGWVNPAIAQTFAWEFITYDDWPCAGGFEQASGSFFWREQGQVAWNEVQASGSTQSVTIPANTFPGGTIEWYIEATDTNGTTTNTSTYTISTEDTIPTATPRDPVDVPVTGNKPIEFRWTVSNDSGTLLTQSELQTSTDGSTWTTLTTIVGSGLTYTAPAGTFTAGTVYWRVRATNRDGVAGSWSAAASFLSISAASPPVVTVDAVPFATINWQGAGQQAYRIRVDGKLYGTFFGTDKTFTLTEPLADGEHTAEVEIQNSYSLWSDPGSATFTVTNVPGDAVTLSGDFGVDAQLSWTTDSTADDYLVYRNGVRIGHTARKSFTDRLQIGEDDWFVINRIAGGYYTRSNTLLGTTSAETCWITAMDGTEPWTELKLTERSHTEQSYSYQRVHSLRHVSGATLPVLELSPYENRTATYDTAFLDAESARAFENLRGRVVILKARDEELVVGALASIKKTVGDFYRAYEFTVSRIHWEDYIDDQDD